MGYAEGMARPFIGFIVGLILLPVPQAFAQSSVELFGSVTVTLSPPVGSYQTDYEPQLIYGTTTGGRAAHLLTLDAEGRAGFDFGLNWLSNNRFGLQLLVDRASHTLGGQNVNYELAFDYLARLPPDYIELPYSFRRSLPWPATSGEMTVWRVGANGVGRVAGRWVDLTVSGGLLWSKVSGRFEQAGYYEFRLGGHSTLFYNDVLLDMTFDESWQLGYNLGAEAGFRAGSHVAFTAGIRFFGPALEPEVIVGDVLNTLIFDVPRSDIEAALGGKSATFDPWGSPVLRFGVRVGF